MRMGILREEMKRWKQENKENYKEWNTKIKQTMRKGKENGGEIGREW